MKGTSNLILFLTVVLVVSLAIVLGMILLILADLYCSPLLLRRRRNRHRQHAATTDNNPSIHSHSDDIEKHLTQAQLPENQDSDTTQSQEKVEMRPGSPLVYISNPVYDGESGRGSKVGEDGNGNGTPFETPDTSPSRLETEESSGDDEREEISSKMVVVTPQLTPMKKLPADAISVCLKDVGSVGTSGSDTNSSHGVSSYSFTPCTSPSL